MNTQTEITQIVQHLRKNLGDNIVLKGNEFPNPKRIPTGSLELDYITNGGIPVGRWTRIYGGPSSGKTLTTYKILANAQRLGYTCAYINAEQQYESEWAQKQGVNIDDLLVIETSVIEEVGETIEALMGVVDLFIVDSCSTCIPRVKLEDGLNDREYMGINARKWKDQFLHLNSRFDHSRNTIIYIDHVNVQFGSGGIAPLKPPGGKFMEFISSMTLEFQQGSWLWNRDGVFSDVRNTSQNTLSGGTEADGVAVRVQCKKSRVGKPFKTARLVLDLEEGQFDEIEEYFAAAKFFKFVTGGSWLKQKDSEKSIRPKEFKEILRNDPELRAEIRKTMMESSGREIDFEALGESDVGVTEEEFQAIGKKLIEEIAAEDLEPLGTSGVLE